MIALSSAFVAAALVVSGASGASADAADGRRPYEMVWAGRTADTHEPTLAMTSADGWTVDCSNAVAEVDTAADHLLFGDGVVRVRYRAVGPDPVVKLAAPAPVVVPADADTLTLWVYGNTHGPYGPNPPGTPTPNLRADFVDASGAPVTLDFAELNFVEWNKLFRKIPSDVRARLGKGSSFVGFSLLNVTNAVDMSLEFTSFALYAEKLEPLEFKPRPKRGYEIFPGAASGINTGAGRLPFPNTPNTIVPPCAHQNGNIEFEFPEGGSADFGGLKVRYRGGEWMHFAKGGGLFPESARAGAKVKFRRIEDSLVADIIAPPGVEEVRFGSIDAPAPWKSVDEPYLLYGWQKPRPHVLATRIAGRPFFHLAMFDWTQSNAAEPFSVDADGVTSNGGVLYPKKTDGSRNMCVERFVWAFSETHEGVLPNVPHDPSPHRKITGSNCWRVCYVNTNRFDDLTYWYGVRARGIRHMVVRDHEPIWRDGNESFTFRTRAAPKKGGDLMLKFYARAMIDGLGYVYGPYNNYTDLAPVNEFWHEDHALRHADGEMQTSWERCYAPKSTWAVGMCERLIPVIQEKFRFNCAYCDVHTAVPPWSRVDYDARVPGSGSLSQVYYNFGEIMLLQKKTWGGPVYSEGQYHFFYAGLTDGDYAQDPGYGFPTKPWLVDIDLKRIHPLSSGTFGFGRPAMCGFGQGCPDRFLVATAAFGHPGFLCEGSEAVEARSYFMIQAIASKYTQAQAAEISYCSGRGEWVDSSEAILSGCHADNRLRVLYDDGTVVYANGSTNLTLSAIFGKETRVLPPNGLWARSGDGTVESFIGLDQDGMRVRHAHGPEYIYDERGEEHSVRLLDPQGEVCEKASLR